MSHSGGGAPSRLVGAFQDITARREAETKLQHIAYHDSLTSLANRIRFGTCLALAIERCAEFGDVLRAVLGLQFQRPVGRHEKGATVAGRIAQLQ